MLRPLCRRALWVALLLSAGGPAAARADELTITSQAVAAQGEFLTQAPPPPVQGVLCEVDAGVDVNPDTQPILLGRESIFGGSVDDVSETKHGTYVAMVAGAAVNGWGMAGAWPRLKVVSVRALTGGGEEVPASAYRQGIQGCTRAKVDSGIDVRVIELAVGGPLVSRPAAESTDISESVSRARQNGMVVVSPAGNDGGPVNVPAALPGVLAVAGMDPSGALCSFSSRGPQVGIAALGCEMDVATTPDGGPGVGQSTSLASAYVAGVITALRSYRPDLGVEQTESLIRDNAAPTPVGPVLNAAAAFRAAGLGSMVDAYKASTPTSAPAARPCNRTRRVCAVPRLRSIRRHGRRIVIRLKPFPSKLRAVVRADGRRLLRTRSRIIRLRMRSWKVLTIRFSAPGRRPSPALRIRRSALQ
jgi:hypothetical protein